MATNIQNLYGFWKMTGMRFLKADGTWEDEKVLGGTSAFTQSGQINTYTRTSELGFGYSGTFVVQDNTLIINVDVCSLPEYEGKTIRRIIKKTGPESLLLGMADDATGRDYEIEFSLVTRSFLN